MPECDSFYLENMLLVVLTEPKTNTKMHNFTVKEPKNLEKKRKILPP